MPSTDTMAAIPRAIPSPDRPVRSRRVRRPTLPDPEHVGRRHPGRDQRRAGPAPRRGGGHHPHLPPDPAVEDLHRPGQGRGPLPVVGDDDHRGPVGVELGQHREHLVAGPAVEVAGGLVGQDQRGPGHHRPGDGHPLALAARQLRRTVVRAGARARPGPGRPPPAAAAPGPRPRGRAGPGPRCRARSSRRAGRTAGRRSRWSGPAGPTGPGPTAGRRRGRRPGRSRPTGGRGCRPGGGGSTSPIPTAPRWPPARRRRCRGRCPGGPRPAATPGSAWPRPAARPRCRRS